MCGSKVCQEFACLQFFECFKPYLPPLRQELEEVQQERLAAAQDWSAQ